MSKSDEETIALLESMPIEQVRKQHVSGGFGSMSSPGYAFVSQWLLVKESELRDARDAEILSVAKEANSLARDANSRTSTIDRCTRRAVLKDRIIAIIAVIIAAIAARADIMWFISWLISMIRTS